MEQSQGTKSLTLVKTLNLTNDNIKKLALDLLHADSEADAINILEQVGLWNNQAAWRLYGDKEGNFAQTGNQQSLPESALVEKVINCCDTRLLMECQLRGIDPESSNAPRNMRDAVAMFFENRRADDDVAGTLANWAKKKRTEESRNITIAATGDRPTRGRKSRQMCLTIADQGEGQSPAKLPSTILSLNAKNKQRIGFVQGKFNMGGSGALRFCGNHGLQLVISKRHPKLQDKDQKRSDHWGVTIVRREEPSNKSGEPIHSEYTYLAPVGHEKNPRIGEVLSFKSDTLALMPKHDEAYTREVEWGTAIKLYEYETSVGQSNILMKDGLLFALERLMPEIALPIRIHECRGYEGTKDRSFETPLAGLVVRLEDGRGDNLELGFPISAHLRARGMKMRAKIYAFKEDKASTYLRDEGVIFAINGQTHGSLPKSVFARPKAVGLPRLKDSLLVLIDCSTLTTVQREDLFMSSRDRLSKKPIRKDLEREIEQMLHDNSELRNLQNQRRQEDVDSKLSEEKPLEEVLGKVLKSSPSLNSLFLKGQRLTKPFASGGTGNGMGGGSNGNSASFVGKRHPTYFKFENLEYGKQYTRHCETGRRCRLTFVTDAENEYFDRPSDKGSFDLEILDSSREMSAPSYSMTLESGRAHLNMALPVEAKPSDYIVVQTTVTDPTLTEPFINIAKLHVEKHHNRPGKSGKKKKSKGSGTGNHRSHQGISLPEVITVKEGDTHWKRYKFTPDTACHVMSDPDDKGNLSHVFYINADNTALKTEMKYSKQNSKLLQAKFKYGNVLLGLAMLHDDSESIQATADEDTENAKDSVQDRIRHVSQAVAPVLLPMIDQLAGLNENELEALNDMTEDD